MKKFLSIIFLAAVCAAASAQALPSLLINTDAAAQGAGGLSVFGSDSTPLQGYAASTALMEHFASAGAGYGTWQPSAAADKLLSASAAVRIMQKFSFAVDYKSFIQPSYEVTGATGTVSQVTPSFTPKESSIAIGLGYRILDGLSAAVTLRHTSSSLGTDAKASALGFDVSAMYTMGKIRSALAVCNLGGKVNYGGGDYSLPSLVKAGASYEVIQGLDAGAEMAYLFEGAFNAAFGVQYCYAGLVTVRAGYHLGEKDMDIPSYASMGIGFKFAGISLDAAYLLASETLGGSWLAGLSYSF